MSLLDLAAQNMIASSKGPTVLQRIGERGRQREGHEMDMATGLSNLQTADLQRQGMSQEMEMQQQNASLDTEKREAYQRLFDDINSTEDPDLRYQKLQRLPQLAAQYKDATLLQMFKQLSEAYTPGGGYTAQQEDRERGIRGDEARIGLTEAQTRATDRQPAAGAGGKPTYASWPAWEVTGAVKPIIDRIRDDVKGGKIASRITSAYNRITEHAKNNRLEINTDDVKSDLYGAAQSGLERRRGRKDAFNLETFDDNVQDIINRYTGGEARPESSPMDRQFTVNEVRNIWTRAISSGETTASFDEFMADLQRDEVQIVR